MSRHPSPTSLLACLLLTHAGALATEPAHAEKVHVVYWDKWVGWEAELAIKVVDAFNRSQDRIVVDYQPTSQIDRKTLVATAGGDPPDVAGLWAQNVATFADNEALTSLDSFIQADGLTTTQWLDRYFPVYAHICTYRQHVYAGISTPSTLALHWNRTLFRDAGLDPDRPPRDFAEFQDYCKKLTKRDPVTGKITQMGFLPQEPGWWPWMYPYWFGGAIYDGKQITLTPEPATQKSMEWVASVTRDNGGEDVRRFASGFVGQFASPQAAFFTGKIAMIIQGVWFDTYIKQYRPGLDYGVGAWPEIVPGIPDFTVGEADVLVIPKGAHHAKEAWEFIKYVNSHNPNAQTREELSGAELLGFLTGKITPLKHWSPYFTQHHPHPHIDVFRQLASSPHAVSVPQIGIWQEFNREFTACFEKIRSLDEKPETALDYAQKRMAHSWERYLRHMSPEEAVSPKEKP